MADPYDGILFRIKKEQTIDEAQLQMLNERHQMQKVVYTMIPFS